MWLVHLSVAARALLSRAARSMLTVSSITLGVLAIVLMTSLAGSGLATIMLGLEELSAGRMLLLTPKAPERALAQAATAERGFDPDMHAALTASLPHLHASALSSNRGVQDVLSDEGRRARTDWVAATPGFFDVFRMRLSSGRRLSARDGEAVARVCVVGPKLAAKLWHEPAIGHSLSIAGQRCRVVGVLGQNDRFGTNFGFEWDDLVVMPFESVAAADANAVDNAQITLVTDDPAHNDIVKRVLNQRMLARRGNVDNFTFYDLSSVVEKFESTFVLMQALVGLVAGIALLIGGIGVMNMMLVSVSERVSEVGLRKALGATPSAIRSQFLVEAVLLSSVGGVVGVALGIGLALGAGMLVRMALPSWVVAVSWPAALVALLTTVAIGALFGYLPARGAARLSPVEAMRR